MAQDMSPAVAATLTVAVTVPGLFTFFCPAPHEAGSHPADRLRDGQLKASGCTLVLGAAASAATRSPWPAIGALAVGALILWQYQRTRPQEDT